MPAQRLSIVIPTRQVDADLLARSAANARRAGAGEVLLVEPDDGPAGSVAPAPAGPPAMTLLRGPRGRGSQARVGIAATTADLVMILHDDTALPDGAGEALQAAFADPTVGLTCFRLRFDRRHWLLALYEAAARVESVLTSFGDQAMVVRRSVLEVIGGVPPWPLFEDVELARRVRRLARVVKLPLAVTTSARRYVARGVLRQQLSNGVLLARFLFGAPPARLAAIYERQRGAQ